MCLLNIIKWNRRNPLILILTRFPHMITDLLSCAFSIVEQVFMFWKHFAYINIEPYNTKFNLKMSTLCAYKLQNTQTYDQSCKKRPSLLVLSIVLSCNSPYLYSSIRLMRHFQGIMSLLSDYANYYTNTQIIRIKTRANYAIAYCI